MERRGWTEKQKKAMQIIGVTGAVYLSFRFLLPLAAPFLLAGLIGLALNPMVEWLRERWRVPAGVSAAILVGGLLAAALTALVFLARTLIGQLRALADRLPYYIRYFDNWMRDCCCQVERFLGLPDGVVLQNVTGVMEQAGGHLRESGMDYVMDNSLPVVKTLGTIGAGLAIFLIAAVMAAKDMRTLKVGIHRSAFREEIERILRRLAEVGGAYVRSELTIFLATTAVSAAGLWFLKNPYALLVGLGIAFVDLLPIFGAGIIYVPWTVICTLRGEYGRAAVLATLYLICYFLRNTIEAKKMGNHLGLHPAVMLMAAYVGWKLFGLAGFLLGPVGLLIILEFTGESKETPSED